jgi:hypothetical protein
LRTPPDAVFGVLEEIAHAVFMEDEQIGRDFAGGSDSERQFIGKVRKTE